MREEKVSARRQESGGGKYELMSIEDAISGGRRRVREEGKPSKREGTEEDRLAFPRKKTWMTVSEQKHEI